MIASLTKVSGEPGPGHGKRRLTHTNRIQQPGARPTGPTSGGHATTPAPTKHDPPGRVPPLCVILPSSLLLLRFTSIV